MAYRLFNFFCIQLKLKIMLTISLILFLLATIFGMILFTYIIKGRETPLVIAFLHGPLAIAALILLGIYAVNNSPGVLVTLILFFIAALGGFVMAIKDFNGEKIPRSLAVLHGVIAITAIGFLTNIILS